VLEGAKAVLYALEKAGDAVLIGLEDAVKGAEQAVTWAIQAGADLVNAVMHGFVKVVDELTSGLGSTIGGLINLKELHVRDEITGSGDLDLSASIKVGFFGMEPTTFSFELKLNDIWHTIWTMLSNTWKHFTDWILGWLGDIGAIGFVRAIVQGLSQ